MTANKSRWSNPKITKLKRNFSGRGALLGLAAFATPPLAVLVLYWAGVSLLYTAVVGGICLGCGIFYLATKDDVFAFPLLVGVLVLVTVGLIYAGATLTGTSLKW
jgi:hypothetical protein